jgi:hypothetical protein
LKLRMIRLAAVSIAGLFAVLTGASPARAQQTYSNIVNQHFRTVSSGPQSALIVDVDDPNNAAAVRQAAMEQYSARLQAMRPALRQELDFLRRRHLIRPGQALDISDAAIVRHNGRLALPPAHRTRTFPNDDITFTIPTDANVDGHWSVQKAAELNALVNQLYTELKTVIAPPGWAGNVTILNKDPRLGKVDEVIGALLLINNGNVEILFPSFTDAQTEFLAMAQVMAQAFHGPKRIAYDAWEQGMARAAAVVAAKDLQTFNGTALDPANGFFYTPNYDLLNEPPLANSTFTPPTKSDQNFNPTTLSGMLVPRLQMSSTAWLKCYIESPSFFRQFNTAYYTAFNTNSGVANDVNRLRAFAKSALPNGKIELLAFDDWFERQYVLDTSVTPGPKLYAYSQPTFPSSAQGDDSGAAVFLIYYSTTASGDESDLNGIANVVYWDFNFQNRLTLPSFETVNITSGFGTVAPFFTNIGGQPPDKMRVAMDFPVNKEYVRVYFPTGQTGTPSAPNDFSGVMIGADAGALSIAFDNGTNVQTQVVQGEFGGKGGVTAGFTRDQITFTPTGGTAIPYQRNVYQRKATTDVAEVSPIFQLFAPSQVDTLSHLFSAGPKMISLPIKPLFGDLARTLGMDPKTAMLAQYRQDGPGDKYLRYPSLPRYQPGYGLWANFTLNLQSNSIVGERTDNQNDISVALQFGWNQIGPPYNKNVNVSNDDVQIQYLGGDAVSFSQAVSNGWVAAGVIGFSDRSGYEDITTSPPTLPLNILEPWKGYWIRVLVTEGVTFVYRPAGNRSAHPRGRAAIQPSFGSGAWRIPLRVQDSAGNISGAVFGQSSRGSDAFNGSLDVASPPPFTRAATSSVRFPHPDWSTGPGQTGGDFLSDIRRSGTRSEWDVVVNLIEPGQDYTLQWQDTALLPRGTRLTLTDLTTGVRKLMNGSAGYAFRAGKGETTRHFQIVAEPRALGRLAIRNITVHQPPLVSGRSAAQMTISYELTTAAETAVEIRLGNRVVRHISASGRAADTGVNQLVWDLKDDQGRALPGGAYTLQVTARTLEGEQTRSIVPLLVTR